MEKLAQDLKGLEINYITFESGDQEAMIDCSINNTIFPKKSKLIISMSDLNKLISNIKRVINQDLSIECHKINSESNFYQIDIKKYGITNIDLSSFLFKNSIKQIIA